MSDLALDYISDSDPGILRRGRKRFRYVDEATGEPITDPEVIDRIRALAVPPAWTDVWIAPDDRGHIQATGRDAKGRKQYRYHPDWNLHRTSVKFDHLLDFGHALGALRARVDEDQGRRDLSNERVVALVVALLDLTAVRIGSEEYARDNKTFGLTTLRARHAKITSGAVTLRSRPSTARSPRCPVPTGASPGWPNGARSFPASCCSSTSTTMARYERCGRPT